ncbi:MAG TPA: D-2-hydroxyacid dehydrogenase [Gammaproteobacteria bacterium]|nr:D-2-hydroxyacid dehydrogenase [Gammaproteobacteria bacterium]
MRAVFLDLDSLDPRDLDLAPLHGCLTDWQFHDRTRPEQVSARIRHAGVLVTNKVCITPEHIQAAPQLRLICVAATGTDNVALDAAARAGIVVSNARDYATASVVEHVFAMLLTLVRQLDNYRERVRQGDWTQSPHFCLFDQTISELSGKTLGIIGYGVLGKAVAKLARAFSMQVQVAQRLHGPPLPDRVPLPELLAGSDVISLHCPLTEQTRGLIGTAEFARMKSSAILVNTARGGIVDEQALVSALRDGRIAAAAVDVARKEPPEASSPLLGYHSPRLIVTPHIAWASQASRQRLLTEISENITAFLHGRPRNTVQPAVAGPGPG